MTSPAPYNFGGIPKKFSNYKKSKIVILPVPFDKTSIWWQRGQREGPRAIISASQNMELYDIETASEIYRMGIYTEKEIRAKNSVSLIDQVYKKVKKFILDKKFVVILGGEHSISQGAIKAHADFFKELGVVHFDAHTDSRESFLGNKFSHASVMARVQEITSKIVSVGIRSMDISERPKIKKIKIIYAPEFFRAKNWRPRYLQALRFLPKNIYVTFDLDVFDPAFVPSVVAPEPGGLTWYQVMALLEIASRKKNIVGFDVVELSPQENKASDFLAAKLIYKLLSYKFQK